MDILTSLFMALCVRPSSLSTASRFERRIKYLRSENTYTNRHTVRRECAHDAKNSGRTSLG